MLSDVVHNSQKVEVTQESIKEKMGKENVVYKYNRILVSFQKRHSNHDLSQMISGDITTSEVDKSYRDTYLIYRKGSDSQRQKVAVIVRSQGVYG